MSEQTIRNMFLKAQAMKAPPQEQADGLVPQKNALTLIVSNPYAGQRDMVTGFPAPWVFASEPNCDGFSHEKMHDKSMHNLAMNFSALGISVHLSNMAYPRFRLDLDRKRNSFQPHQCERPGITIIPDEDDQYAQKGLGVVWMRTPMDTDTPLYLGEHNPTQEQLDQMLMGYDDHYETLKCLVNNHMDRFGGSLHINIMPFSREEAFLFGADEHDIPAFIVADGDGLTAKSEFSDKLAHTISEKGYHIERNILFPTGEITRRFAARDNGAHALQLKIFDELYLDPDTLQKSRGYRKLASDLHSMMSTMAEYAKQHITKLQKPKADILHMPHVTKPNDPKPV